MSRSESSQRPVNPYFECLDPQPPLFKVNIETPTKELFKKYQTHKKTLPDPIVSEINTAPTDIKKQNEFVLIKKDLSADDISVWNLFEKVMAIPSRDTMTRHCIMKSFRKFAKTHHPDTSSQERTTDFSYIVKVKNEMMSLYNKKKNETINTPAQTRI